MFVAFCGAVCLLFSICVLLFVLLGFLGLLLVVYMFCCWCAAAGFVGLCVCWFCGFVVFVCLCVLPSGFVGFLLVVGMFCCCFCGVCLLVFWCCVLVGFVVLCVCWVCGFFCGCLLVVTVKDTILFGWAMWNVE